MKNELTDFLDAMYYHFNEHAFEDFGRFPNHRKLFITIKKLTGKAVDDGLKLDEKIHDSQVT